MKEIWFWISKDLAELGITLAVILVAIVWFGGRCLVNMIKKRHGKLCRFLFDCVVLTKHLRIVHEILT